MASTNMARLNDLVRMNAPGALDGIIRLEIFEALKEFFQRTNIWLLEVPIFIVPAINDYMITTGQNVVVNRLMRLDRSPSLPPPGGPPSYVPTCPPQYLSVTQSTGHPEMQSQDPVFRTGRAGALLNAGSKCPILRIGQNPTANETWVATLALNTCDPTDPDGFVSPPDWIMEKYLSYLASGVLTRLYLQPGKPYSSMPGSQYHGRKFNEGVGLARTEVKNMFVFGGQSWQFPSGWNSRFRNFGAYTGFV